MVSGIQGGGSPDNIVKQTFFEPSICFCFTTMTVRHASSKALDSAIMGGYKYNMLDSFCVSFSSLPLLRSTFSSFFDFRCLENHSARSFVVRDQSLIQSPNNNLKKYLPW